MKGFIGIIDHDWFAFLSQQPELGEVNFYGRWRFGYLMEITALPKPVIRDTHINGAF